MPCNVPPPAPSLPEDREAAALIAHGNALLRIGEWAQAAARYHAALDIAPDSAEAYFHLSSARAQMGDIAGAIDSLNDCLAFDPDRAAARTNLGYLLRATGQTAEALEEFRRALFLSPRDPTGRFNVASVLADLDRLEEAVVWCSQAAEAKYCQPSTRWAPSICRWVSQVLPCAGSVWHARRATPAATFASARGSAC